MEKISYGGWQNCYRLANGIIELVVTGDVGPRIIRLGFPGQDNEFREFEPMLGQTGGDEFRIYGGHRFWHAPEVMPRTYQPDNAPVAVEEHDGVVRFTPPTEPATGIQKVIEIRLWPNQPRATVTHRLHNQGMWGVELAPWALSVMNKGGRCIIPLPPRGSHTDNLLPANLMTMWAYTNMADPRWTWGEKYIMLRQDPTVAKPQKAGVMVTDGWVAYARNGHLFVKQFAYQPGAPYPDWGCSVETFTFSEMLEVETLGPLVTLKPGATVEHVEEWSLFDDVPMPQNDADVDRDVLPKVRGR
jgi:hypothetical protein